MQVQAHANLATISNTGLNDEVGVKGGLFNTGKR
jgi:hypothetical protein